MYDVRCRLCKMVEGIRILARSYCLPLHGTKWYMVSHNRFIHYTSQGLLAVTG